MTAVVLLAAQPAWAGGNGWKAVDANRQGPSQAPIRQADYLQPTNEAEAAAADVRPVAYTTTQSASQLRWLPVRPGQSTDSESADADAPPKLVAPQTVRTATSGASTDAAQRAQFVEGMSPTTEAMDDPFGDGPSLLVEPVQDSGSGTQLPGSLAESGAAEAVPTPEPLPLPGELLPEMQLETGDDEDISIEESLALGPPPAQDECPSPDDMRPISEITNDIRAQGSKFPTECTLQGGEFQARSWQPITFTWKASGLCHHPLYFEQVQVERYGHNLGPLAQPFASGAHFFLTVPIMPYKMGLTPPNECMYTLGYYRPGSCAPWILDPIPLSVRAGLMQAGAWTGGAFAIP